MKIRLQFSGGAVAWVAMLLVVAGTRPAGVSAGPVLPEFSADNFTPGAPIDNPYFPLVPGTIFHYSAVVTDPDTGETGFQRDEDFVTGRTKTIAGVSARLVRARSWLDNVLIEDTIDYYAQDKVGNVWYLGEDTSAFDYDDSGHLINTDRSGSFRTGVHGAKPGFIMPANPTVGFTYYQEFAQNDGALDQARILSRTESITVPVGSFSNVLRTEETTALEPGVVENKLYAPGIGELVTLEDLQPNGEPLNRFELQGVTTTAVPLPAGVWMGLGTMGLALSAATRAYLGGGRVCGKHG